MESLEENHIKAVPKKIYNPEWEKLPIFKGWLINGDKGETFAKCRACDRYLRAQRNDIYKHSQSVKHKTNMRKKGLRTALDVYPIKRICSPKVNPNITKFKVMKSEVISNTTLPIETEDGTSYSVEIIDKYNESSHYEQETLEYENEEHVFENNDSNYGEIDLEDEEEMEQEQEQEEPESSNNNLENPNSVSSSLFSEGECEIFGVFVTNEMKGFDPKKRKLFKKGIYKLLLDLENED